ncbi:hypothetical protein HJB84_02755 [Rhizobium sp. NZLR1b]|uniref:hypothetical protein n=1 Tax=Rhizobium sp. NZLR1b TaxID=2731099 RepID=UPI001C836E79|nr:hypothetical protein [Rhizobium sp. NZLR1b]MBX5168786.1 hypothetical protein [Rhizobium sp. NZLR1b]
MSLVRHNDFLKRDRLPVAMDFRQLDLPTAPEAGGKSQVYSFPKGYRFSILNSDRSKIGHCIVVSYGEWDGLGGKFQVQNVSGDQPFHLSNWQISQLERQGRFIPHESKLTGRQIDTSIALDPEQTKQAQRKLDYVVSILRENGKGTVMPRRKAVLRAALKHAQKAGDEKPFCYNTLKTAIRAYIDNPFNRLLAVAPGRTRGNREHTYCDRLEDRFREAAEYAWSLPKGTALDARRRYEELLLLPENRDLIPLVTDEDGNIVKPSQSTIERRFYGVDHFTRDVLRKDLESAMRIHDLRIPQLQPTVPLEVVEVDYTELDVSVIDDLYSFIWGRPNIILFRDRMCAGILGFTIFFGKPSFEAFLHGFKQAIYPKDMSEYPGLDWTMHGLMSVLVVDADTHLQSDKMRAFCDEIGVTLHEVRPGEPNSKGGLERTIRTLNDSLIHNLPGTTLSNVVRRKEGGKEKELGQPKIKFSELVKHVTAWACDYNRSSHKGLGFLRSLKGVPQQLFDDNIHKAGNRQPINPEIFARLSGEQHEAAIQDGCIVWDYIRYSSPELVVMATSPTSTPPNRANARKPRKPTTLYQCCRDPSDLGFIYVTVPGADLAVKVPAVAADLSYASGLRLYQHKRAIQHHNKHSRRPVTNIRDLEASLAADGDDLTNIHAERRKHKTADQLAAFYRGVATKTRRSRIVETVTSAAASSNFIDPANPFSPPGRKRASPAANDYRPEDTPPEIHQRDENGQLIPGDPLAAKVEQHAARKSRKPKAGVAEQREHLSGYDNTDDIEFLRKLYENDEDD